MISLYPLRFRPLLRHYIWGGDQLATRLQKPVPAGQTCAESWEICDRGDDQSVVAAGGLTGTTLGELVRERPSEIFGRQPAPERFPLLLKFLDARRTLSVQVHPNDRQAALLAPPDLGKTEAWVVLAAEPESVIYAGLLPGVDAEQLQRAIDAGRCAECLFRLQPRVGDCIFLPAGTVHALGEGLLVAEIQQASDTTYRLFDWNRVGADGQPRPLHVRAALSVIDFARGPVRPQTPQPTDRAQVERLVACDRFVLERVQVEQPLALGGDGRFHVLAVLSGSVMVAGDASTVPLRAGDSILLPAAVGETAIHPVAPAVLLDAYLP